jgi:hypothetical protein
MRRRPRGIYDCHPVGLTVLRGGLAESVEGARFQATLKGMIENPCFDSPQ